jgi:tetratricopeptide (TPR) repeat protein
VLAHSGLADALTVLPTSGDAASKEVFPAAKTAIARALQLDSDSAEAHTSDAGAKFWFDWDFKGAEAAARRAISLNENYSLAHLYLAHVLSNTGRHDEALAVIQQALVVDPLSLIVGAMRGQFLYQAGRDSASVEQFKATLGMEPRFWVGQICAAKTYEKLGMYSEAFAACDKAWEYSGGNSEALSLAGYVHAVSGKKRTEAEAKIHTMLERKQQRYVPPYNVALVFAGLGETERALQWLRRLSKNVTCICPSYWITSGTESDRTRSSRNSCRAWGSPARSHVSGLQTGGVAPTTISQKQKVGNRSRRNC